MIKYLPDNFASDNFIGAEEAGWPVWHNLLEVAMDIPMRYFGKNLQVQIKADSTPVTEADKHTERALRQVISGAFPAHAIIGEEYGSDGGNSGEGEEGYQWVIDPIDGTKSFICGMPLFGCLVGLLKDGVPIVGMVVMPALGQVFFGAGDSAWCNGEVIQVERGIKKLPEARVSIGEGNKFCLQYPKAIEVLSPYVSMVRFYHDCYSFCLLAGGGLHGVIEMGLQAYDILPIVPIIRGAGGCVSDWGGKNINLVNFKSENGIIASANEDLHGELLDIVGKF